MKRKALVAFGLSAMLSVGLVPASAVPAQASSGVIALAPAAALPAPAIRAAGGAGSITVAWSKIPGAVSYTVEYSTSSTFRSAKKVSVSATKGVKVLTGVQNDVAYFVRVRAVAGAGSTSSVSVVKKAIPDTGYPRELTVTVAPAGKDKVKVSWAGQGRATKVGVLAGSNSIVTKHLFRSAWYPATVTSIVLTVPAQYRDEMGTGSGNPIHVKVATYNSLSASTSMPTASDPAKAYRLTRAGSYTWASAIAPVSDALRVATWNVKSVTSSASLGGYTWKERRYKVRNGILASGAALVGAQEIPASDAGLGNGKLQWEDLRDLLAPSGFAIANEPVQTPREMNTTAGAQLYYKTAELERLSGGFVSPRSMGISWPSGLLDRLWSWAKFRVKATGAVFYAASVHLPTDDGRDLSELRVREIKAISSHLTNLAGGRPIVILADLNNSVLKSATGPDNALRLAGWYDAASAVKRSGTQYSTVNTTNQVDNLSKPGFPYTPYRALHVAGRVDYIMTKNAPGAARYANQLVLTSAGNFDTAFQGSDHNLQWADIGIPGGS
ncbi:hypothetical protein ACFFGH_31545 [Lysobacter korlensis]|uniref:Fibronectin type-III domain-containing protein n=1 Tax=Lysobacter korlensis TaxID=553636 RepID=A0ABV6RZI6_9GAMM